MRTVVSMFDESGNALRPWAEAGYICYAIDILNDGRIEYCGDGFIEYLKLDLSIIYNLNAIAALKPIFIMGFPPCTDLAVSGARHFEAKRKRNPKFQQEAVDLALSVKYVADKAFCPYFFENPISVLSTFYKKPNHIFSPHEYGGYLPEDDVHPRWPEIIPPRDAYPKTTCLWTGNGFLMPKRKSVIAQPDYPGWRKLGGKSQKTKQIRSETPRGFSKAVYLANGKPRWND